MGDSSSPSKRKSLEDRYRETKVKDPSEHAKRQVGELDKTAKASQLKRKLCREQILADQKEIEAINAQIATIHLRYDPLCEQLKEDKEKKAHLLRMLEQCLADEKKVMGEMKGTVQSRVMDDSKLSKKMASLNLRLLRGFSVEPASTFKQGKS